jgi:hypothetical protein
MTLLRGADLIQISLEHGLEGRCGGDLGSTFSHGVDPALYLDQLSLPPADSILEIVEGSRSFHPVAVDSDAICVASPIDS